MTANQDLKDQIERVIPLYSTSALRMFHDSIRRGLAHEDSLPEHETRLYGYRENPDFKWQANAIELEMASRNQEVERINW
jgi:hypothetical protein